MSERRDYFKTRGDLIARILLEQPANSSMLRERWTLGIGALCLIGPGALECWAAKALVDRGYFVRFSVMMGAVIIAGVVIFLGTQTAHVVLGRTAITSRHQMIERTLTQLLKVGASIAHRLVGRPKAD